MNLVNDRVLFLSVSVSLSDKIHNHAHLTVNNELILQPNLHVRENMSDILLLLPPTTAFHSLSFPYKLLFFPFLTDWEVNKSLSVQFCGSYVRILSASRTFSSNCRTPRFLLIISVDVVYVDDVKFAFTGIRYG